MEFPCCNILETALGTGYRSIQLFKILKREVHAAQVYSYRDIAVYITRHMCLSVQAGFDRLQKKFLLLIHSDEADMIIGGKKGCETHHES